jgi:hypothetical protein
MSHGSFLIKEKIVSLSQLQRNPSRALSADIVRIVKSGHEIGIFFSKEEFEDLIEEQLSLKNSFQKELKKTLLKSKRGKLTPLR